MARSHHLSVKVCCGGVLLLAATASVGCQSDYAGQTLPSPYWQKDDIQYFPPGPEFKLSREAAAMKMYGTGRGSRPAGAPLRPADAGPFAGNPDEAPNGANGPGPAPAVGPGAIPDAPPPAAPADNGAAPGEPAEADPFNP